MFDFLNENFKFIGDVNFFGLWDIYNVKDFVFILSIFMNFFVFNIY